MTGKRSTVNWPMVVLIERTARNNVRGTGYVVDSLEAALLAFHRSSSFKEGALLAVNLGDDADTTGAVYGQIAGAYFGIEGTKGAWSNQVVSKRLIEDFAEKLYEVGGS